MKTTVEMGSCLCMRFPGLRECPQSAIIREYQSLSGTYPVVNTRDCTVTLMNHWSEEPSMCPHSLFEMLQEPLFGF
jgi:hypothetical protein